MYWFIMVFYLILMVVRSLKPKDKIHEIWRSGILLFGLGIMSAMITESWRDWTFVYLTVVLLYLTMLFFTRDHNGANICIVLALSLMTSIMYFTIVRHSNQTLIMTGLYVLLPVMIFGPKRKWHQEDIKVLLMIIPILILSFTLSRFQIRAEEDMYSMASTYGIIIGRIQKTEKDS